LVYPIELNTLKNTTHFLNKIKNPLLSGFFYSKTFSNLILRIIDLYESGVTSDKNDNIFCLEKKQYNVLLYIPEVLTLSDIKSNVKFGWSLKIHL